jgi:eukaryotic translation initiation factor 2C
MVRERLSDWCKQNSNSLPDNILYYRDGVSDAQVEHVKDEELPQIRDSFNAFAAERETNPKARLASVKITAVVCTKRHHTRIYPLNQQDIQQGNGNCKPGTLVERSITSPYFTDFYLQSHNGIKGTAKPAHYWVLLNEMNLPISELQHLTYNLCLTYVRATLGVSYAAPAYYADRLCERARCYLRDFFSPSRQRRNELDQSRYRYEKDEGLWTPQAQVEKMTPVEKEKERARVKEKKERVEKRLMESVMREAGRRFEARDKDDRVDRDRDEGACRDLLRTMYWM